ncbi:hypothetical protein HDV01_004159 [Terramyces sp. JEL0728]|nr:hypothetical protein HDV01_004159 [Terramyces sp. JEL0728]
MKALYLIISTASGCLPTDIDTRLLQLTVYTTDPTDGCLTQICFPTFHKSIYISPSTTYEKLCNATMCITEKEEETLDKFLTTARLSSHLGKFEYTVGNCSQSYNKSLPLFVGKNPPTPTTNAAAIQIQTQTDGVLVQTIQITNRLLQTARATMQSPQIQTMAPSNNLLNNGKLPTSTLASITNQLPTEAVMNPNTLQQNSQAATTTSGTPPKLRCTARYSSIILLLLII